MRNNAITHRDRHPAPTPTPATLAVVAVALALFVLTNAVHAEDRPAGESKPVDINPHWKSDRCNACHAAIPTEHTPAPIQDVDRLCLSCHDGTKAKAEVHPIGRSVIGQSVADQNISLPQGWPTTDDRLTCLTCHDVEVACDRERTRPAHNATLLRDRSEGDILQFCAKCHNERAYRFRSPHQMLTDAGYASTNACQRCHINSSTGTGMQTRTIPALHSDELTLCGSCHSHHVEYFDPGHYATAMPDTYRMNLTLFQVTAKLPSTPAGRYILPLGPGDTILCSTCHNPHQVGLFPPDNLMSFGAMPNDNVASTPLRLPPRQLCGACHGK